MALCEQCLHPCAPDEEEYRPIVAQLPHCISRDVVCGTGWPVVGCHRHRGRRGVPVGGRRHQRCTPDGQVPLGRDDLRRLRPPLELLGDEHLAEIEGGQPAAQERQVEDQPLQRAVLDPAPGPLQGRGRAPPSFCRGCCMTRTRQKRRSISVN
jgi:hypothetical protein